MPEFHMRFPTNFDYDRLCNVTGSDNDKIRWRNVLTIVDAGNEKFTGRGFHSAKWELEGELDQFQRNEYAYFRPAFDCKTPEELPDDLKLGDIIIVGTLFVNDAPVRVPQEYDYRTVCKRRELQRNAHGTIKSCELRPALNEPDYAIWAIYIGDNTFIADRPIVKGTSAHETKCTT